LSTLLDVHGLSFEWPNREVLRDLNFSIDQHQIVSILGVNGAGKSTLLKCLNRILKPQHGTVDLLSKDIHSMPLIDVARHLAYVPQSVGTNFPMDVFDVVLLGRRPYISWSIGPGDRAKVSKTLHYLNLQDFAFRRYDQLSGGERQRVILAKALAQEPHLFLLDEPTSDLDLKNQILVMEKMRKLVSSKQAPCSALIAIHDIDMAARFSDKILLLHEGKIKAYGPPIEVLTSHHIAEVFGVEAEIQPTATKNSIRIIINGAIEKENMEEE